MLYHRKSEFAEAISRLEAAIEILEKVVPPLDQDPHLRKQRSLLLGWYQENKKDAEAARLSEVLSSALPLLP